MKRTIALVCILAMIMTLSAYAATNAWECYTCHAGTMQLYKRDYSEWYIQRFTTCKHGYPAETADRYEYRTLSIVYRCDNTHCGVEDVTDAGTETRVYCPNRGKYYYD